MVENQNTWNHDQNSEGQPVGPQKEKTPVGQAKQRSVFGWKWASDHILKGLMITPRLEKLPRRKNSKSARKGKTKYKCIQMVCMADIICATHLYLSQLCVRIFIYLHITKKNRTRGTTANTWFGTSTKKTLTWNNQPQVGTVDCQNGYQSYTLAN